MAFNKFQSINATSGREQLVTALETTTGAPDANKIIQTTTDGKIHLSLMPVGIGPDTTVVLASEDLSAGDYVNIWNDAGTPKARLADASNTRPAHGYVKSAFLTSANATVYFEGANDGQTGLTPGARYFLGTAGNATITVPVSPASNLHQFLGIAINATTINTDIADEIEI